MRHWKYLVSTLISLGALSMSGCCTLEVRDAVYGEITWPNGDPATPTAVVSIVDGVEEPCSFSPGSYSCWERGSGVYSVRVTVDAMEWTWDIPVDGDHCHVDPLERDLVLETP